MQATLAMPAATELLPLIPELVLVGAAFALLMLDLFLKDSQRVVTHVLSVASLVLVAGVIAVMLAEVIGEVRERLERGSGET